MSETEINLPDNFIHEIIRADLAAGKNGGAVKTRFQPEPNGYLHIGHAKSICLNYGTAQKFGGKFNLRLDDTNPVKEDTEYVESILEDVKWLGADWEDRFFHASDYFDQMDDKGKDTGLYDGRIDGIYAHGDQMEWYMYWPIFSNQINSSVNKLVNDYYYE